MPAPSRLACRDGPTRTHSLTAERALGVLSAPSTAGATGPRSVTRAPTAAALGSRASGLLLDGPSRYHITLPVQFITCTNGTTV
jgi:hypothetical protein